MIRLIHVRRNGRPLAKLPTATLIAAICLFGSCLFAVTAGGVIVSAQEADPSNESSDLSEDPGSPLPWDYSPYRVLIWIASEDPALNAATLDAPLRTYLDVDFSALWRVDIVDAPPAVRSAANRSIGSLSYDAISASDPVIAVKRDHPDAVRIRIVSHVGLLVQKVHATRQRIEEVKRRAAAIGNESIDGVEPQLVAVEGDEMAVKGLWAEQGTEAILVSRGMAQTLDSPEAKLISPPVEGLVSEAVESYDKIFIVRIDHRSTPSVVSAVEMETQMHHFGPVATERSLGNVETLSAAVGRAVTRAFAPVLRIEQAGQTSAEGLLRAGGLIVREQSPANVRVNDVLEPMVRKDDRNGNPILIGAIDWAFLHVTEPEIAVVQAGKGTGFRIGDRVIRVAGKSIQLPQEIEHAWEQHRGGEGLTVEIDRKGKPAKVAVKLDGSDGQPLRLVYLGFTGGERRGQVIVRSVISGGPADGKLQIGDAIVSVGESKISSIAELDRLVVADKPNQTIKLSVGRDEKGVIDVTLDPSETSARKRNKDTDLYMEYYSGRPGGLQGRSNARTFRTALKARPFGDETLVRLHAKGDEKFPLIGYEIYQKEISSRDMTFVGRTDWNGRLHVEKTMDPLRLLYVKNGGAVLARLPTVPGLTAREVADISGDDMRLQAEAYIRGVQNAIIDLVAIRELFKARIHLRLKKGTPENMEKAKDLLIALRLQPTSQKLADDMARKQDFFVKAIGRNTIQRRKVDDMFKITRDLLSKHINPKLVNALGRDVVAAEENGGKLPEKRDETVAKP
jgi:hypothetical protein